jgi:hypothetical protein
MQKLTKHLTPSTGVALLAFCFAVTGVSFAATGAGSGGGNGGGAGNKNNKSSLVASTAKSKGKTGPRKSKGKTGPRGARGPAGPAGKNGVAGSAGPAGATGPQGPAGPNGTNGTNGEKGEQGEKGKPGKAGEAGAPGEPGEAGVIHGQEPLPKGASETGAWSVSSPELSRCFEDTGKGRYEESKCLTEAATSGTGNFEKEPVNKEGTYVATVSFTIPLAVPITSSKGKPEEEHVFFTMQPGVEKAVCEAEPEPAKKRCEEKLAAAEAACPGTAAKPEAAPGDFCAYTEELAETLAPSGNPVQSPSANFGGGGGTGTSGALLVFSLAAFGETEFGYGTWAVTAAS